MNFKIYYSLLPFSLLYGAGVKIRNKLFDRGILKETSFPVPLISVGNITVGGTGKTPHTEYLVNLLKDKYKVAVLSRGYKRKSKGFQICSEVCSADMLGDEPYQIASKFPEIIVAVDADRRNGISRLMELDEAPDVIILDDAYQHRYVKPGLNILLTDYNRLLYKDFMLPAGRLREPSSGKRRADVIVVTKTPETIKSEEIREISEDINPNVNQSLFFSGFTYKNLRNVFNDKTVTLPKETSVLIVTGIAQPYSLEKYVKEKFTYVDTLKYPDHHYFNKADITLISDKYEAISNNEKAIIVTEKDAVKLRNCAGLSEDIKSRMFFLPLEILFLQDQNKVFNQIILDYVTENKRNR